MSARYTALAPKASIAATKTFPARACRLDPLRKDIAAVPDRMPTTPVEIWTGSKGEKSIGASFWSYIRTSQSESFIRRYAIRSMITLCSSYSVLLARTWIKTAHESERVAIAAQPDRCCEKCCGDYHPDPQARADQEVPGSEVCHRIHCKGARRCNGLHTAAAQAVLQQGGEI